MFTPPHYASSRCYRLRVKMFANSCPSRCAGLKCDKPHLILRGMRLNKSRVDHTCNRMHACLALMEQSTKMAPRFKFMLKNQRCDRQRRYGNFKSPPSGCRVGNALCHNRSGSVISHAGRSSLRKYPASTEEIARASVGSRKLSKVLCFASIYFASVGADFAKAR